MHVNHGNQIFLLIEQKIYTGGIEIAQRSTDDSGCIRFDSTTNTSLWFLELYSKIIKN